MDSDTERHLADLLRGMKQELSKAGGVSSDRERLMRTLRDVYDRQTSECSALLAQHDQLTAQTLQSHRQSAEYIRQQIDEIRRGIEQMRPC